MSKQITETTIFEEFFFNARLPLLIIRASDGVIIEANRAAVSFYGYPKDIFIGMNIGQLNTLSHDEIAQKLIIAVENKKPHFNFQHRLASGEIRDVEVQTGVFTNESDSYIYSIIYDITEQTSMNRIINRESEKSVAILRNASDGIHILNKDGVLIEASDSFCSMLGYQREELIGKHVSLWDAQLSCTELEDKIKVQFSKHKRFLFETRHRRHNGTVFDVEVSGLMLELDGKAALFNSSRDITERRQAENKIEALMDEQSKMLEISFAGIAKVQNHNFIWVNPSLEKMFGYGRGELIGKDIRVIHLTEQSYLDINKEFFTVTNGEIYRIQNQFRRKDETVLWIDLSVIMLNLEDGTSFWAFNDINEIKKNEQQMLAARQSAEDLAQSKTNFLANMSHEIRTPMNAIIGLSNLALNKKMPMEVRDYMEKINTSSESLLGILNDILDFSKIDAGKLKVENVNFDLRVMLENVYNLFFARAQEKHLGFSIKIDSDIPDVLIGDQLRIQQILSNLLGNAIKFTAQGKVYLQVELLGIEGSQVRVNFSVSDNGIGISAEDQTMLFQPFTQVDTTITRRFGGTGLGLAISNRLLQLMDSNFHIDSAPDMGSTFSFELRLGLASGELSEKIVNRNLGRKKGVLGAELLKQGKALAGCRIMVAEDSRINQMVVSEYLKLSGVIVDIANNGIAAIQLLEKNRYDAILMDIHMPEMGGVEATKYIRQKVHYNQLPIIALSAGVTELERERCIECGMNDFVSKPVNPVELINVLCRWVEHNVDAHAPITVSTPLHALKNPELQALKGFEFTNILAMLSGDEIVLIELLDEFHIFLTGVQIEIDNLISSNQPNKLIGLMHKLKGTASSMGAVNLQQAAAAMEDSLKISDFDHNDYEVFKRALSQTISEVSLLKI